MSLSDEERETLREFTEKSLDVADKRWGLT